MLSFYQLAPFCNVAHRFGYLSIPVLDCGHPPLSNLGGPGSTHHLRPPEPWMKGDILNAIKLRNKSYSEYRKNTNEQQLEKCRKLQNVVNSLTAPKNANMMRPLPPFTAMYFLSFSNSHRTPFDPVSPLIPNW